MNKKRVFNELEHIFIELSTIKIQHFNNEDFYFLFTTNSGLIKGKWYPYKSIVNPASEIAACDLKENQELIIDKCLYEAFVEKNHAKKNIAYGELTLPDIAYKDVLCLKDVTIYSGNKEINLPSFLLLTSNITGFSLIDKNFKL